MKLENIIKAYYDERLRAGAPSQDLKARLRRRVEAAGSRRRFSRRPAVVFHAALITILGWMLWSNRGTIRSLERIDPENTRIRRVEETLRDGLSALRSAAVRTAPSTEKGETS